MAGAIITVGTTGKAKVEAVGFTGDVCSLKTRVLVEKLSGGEPDNVTTCDKAEMHMTPSEGEAEGETRQHGHI